MTDDLTEVPGVGPAIADKLRDAGIETFADLTDAIESRGSPSLIGIDGLGVKKIEKIEDGLARLQAGETEPIPLAIALPVATRIVDRLRDHKAVKRVTVAGSVRRAADPVGDIDVLLGTDHSNASAAVLDAVAQWAVWETIEEHGKTKFSARLDQIQVDIRAVPLEAYGAALVYFTGPPEHNIALRQRAKARGLKLSEYGLRDRESEAMVAGASEAAVYDGLDLRVPAPEARSDDLATLEAQP